MQLTRLGSRHNQARVNESSGAVNLGHSISRELEARKM